MTENKFKSGMMVRISNDISNTVSRFSLDEDGKMKAMAGKVFPIEGLDDDRAYIKNFMWSLDDLRPDSDPEPLPPEKTNILFDPKELR